jgi:hypothetical protein
MSTRDVVICSFYTPDEYYGNHAKELKEQLTSMGIAHELLQVEKKPGEDWADVTRKKIGFIRDICHKHPDKMVFWIDIDCRISYLPEYISNSTADLIGFQRSFGSPMQIGYANRTRFWEPSFWGINATTQARKLIEDAYALEQKATLKATDDYFLEEAWRANARNLTFQMIPTTEILRERAVLETGQRVPFFSFGSSGNVAEFKNKVVQHGNKKTQSTRGKLLSQAKQLESMLPQNLRNTLRRIADTTGVTGALTKDQQKSLDPVRGRLLGKIALESKHGNRRLAEIAKSEFSSKYLPSYLERSTIEASDAFLHYAERGNKKIPLMWWVYPYPGNFGDWLSPLIVSSFAKSGIVHQAPTDPSVKKHIVGLGSIGRFIRGNSVVLGTGISSDDLNLHPRADYVSLRGPHSAKALQQAGGKLVGEFGDPGIVLSEIMPADRGKTNGKVAFVRHFSHSAIPVQLPAHFDEISVMMSKPSDIENFVKTLVTYDKVITSAMHVMIVCQSYGIPCGLVTFKGFEDNVHGSGIKYEDYALGAGVEVMNPVAIDLDLRSANLDNLVGDIKVSQEKKQQVAGHVRQAIARFEK